MGFEERCQDLLDALGRLDSTKALGAAQADAIGEGISAVNAGVYSWNNDRDMGGAFRDEARHSLIENANNGCGPINDGEARAAVDAEWRPDNCRFYANLFEGGGHAELAQYAREAAGRRTLEYLSAEGLVPGKKPDRKAIEENAKRLGACLRACEEHTGAFATA